MLAERPQLKFEPLRQDRLESVPLDPESAADYQFSPVAQVTLDRNGCIIRINVAAAVLLKGERSQLLNIPFIAFVEKSYCQIFLDHLSSSLRFRKKGAIQLGLASYTRAAGPVELLTLPGVSRATGEAICRAAIVARATAESPANGKIAVGQSYEELFELSLDAVIVQVGGEIVEANPAAAKLLGAESSDELRGINIYEIIHPDYHQLVQDRISRLEQGETALPAVEERFVRLDGQNVVVNVISKSTTFHGTAATMILARDLSKDAQLREDLIRARDLAGQILTNNSVATAIISLETGRFLRANQAFCDLAGFDRHELSSRTLSDIGWDLSANVQSEVMQNFGSERSVQNCEARIRRSDGSFVEVLASGKTILFGSQRAVLLMVQDLTDLRRLKQDIVKIAEEEQRRFSRDLHDSHCQDLTAIAFFAETIAETLRGKDAESADQVRALGKMVRKSAENVHMLAAGLGSEQVEQSGLREALKQLAARTSYRFGLACTAKIDRKARIRDSDLAVNLYRIAQEAASNAAKHGHASRIDIKLNLDGDTGILRIEDDGKGFSGDEKPDRLGLRTMEYRAAVIKGILSIDSKPGTGTVVTCSFPASAAK